MSVLVTERRGLLVCTAPGCSKSYPLSVAASTVRSHVLSAHGATTCLRRRRARSAQRTLVAERLRKRRARAKQRGLCLPTDGIQRCGASLTGNTAQRCKRTRLASPGWRCPDHPRVTLADAEVRGGHGAAPGLRTVHVGPSRFHRGVIADVHLRPGDYVTEFACGDRGGVRHPGYRLKLPGLEVLWGLPDPVHRRGLGSLVNSASGTGLAQNACFVRVPHTCHVFVRATADILPGQEVFASYGSGYRLVQ